MSHFYSIKKHLTIAISSLIFFGLSLNVQGQLPFSDDFESGNFSSGGWDVTGNAEISTQSPAQGSYCVKGPGTYIIAKQISSINENLVTIEYEMKASQTGSNCVNFKVLDSDEEIASSVFFRHNGNIVAYDGEGYSQQINLMPYNSDTWYAMKIVLDMSNKTYDVFIDGVLKADNFDFYSMDFTMPYEFNWNSGETWGTGWIDDVSISGSGSPSNLPFEDCFESGNFSSGGWDVTGNAEISTQSPAQGSFCVKGPGTYIIAKQISSINENFVSIEYDMKASQTGSNCVNFKVLDSDEEIASSVFFRHNGNIVAYDGEGYSQQINLMPYNSDTWYAMKIVLDMSSKTYDVFIDGVLKADNFDFYSMDFTMPYEFNWNSGETWGTGWIDCVNIYAGTTGVEDLGFSKAQLNVFPNPTSGLLNFKSEINQELQISIFNTYGQNVFSTAVLNENTIDISGLSAGIYFVKLTDENGNILLSKKILKE